MRKAETLRKAEKCRKCSEPWKSPREIVAEAIDALPADLRNLIRRDSDGR